MKSEIVEPMTYKIGFALAISLLEPLFRVVMIYNPIFGAFGIIGNGVTAAIQAIRKENSGVVVVKKSRLYHISSSVVAFSMATMFSTGVSKFFQGSFLGNYFEFEPIVTSFIIGLITPSIPILLKSIGSALKLSLNNFLKQENKDGE